MKALSKFLVNNKDYFTFKWSVIESGFFKEASTNEFKQGMHYVFGLIEAHAEPELPPAPTRDPDMNPEIE